MNTTRPRYVVDGLATCVLDVVLKMYLIAARPTPFRIRRSPQSSKSRVLCAEIDGGVGDFELACIEMLIVAG